MLSITVTKQIKLTIADILQQIEDRPLKREQKYAGDVLRVVIRKARLNNKLLFNNELPVNFYCNGYKQVKHICNNGNKYTLRELLSLMQEKDLL